MIGDAGQCGCQTLPDFGRAVGLDSVLLKSSEQKPQPPRGASDEVDSKPGPLPTKGSGTRKLKIAQRVGHPPRGPKSPALEGVSRTGHPKCKIITPSETTGVVFDSAAETVLWKANGPP
jgi:hypothetical protein